MFSGTTRRHQDSIQTLWSSLLPTSAFSENQSDDEEVVKLSLLLKSIQLLVTGLRHKQLSSSAQLQSTVDELRCITMKKEQYESETKTLRKELSIVKLELQSVEAKAKKSVMEADTAKANCDKLQSRIASEVEARLHNMFKNCLQQNKAATVLDMMTQMYHDTPVPEPECVEKRSSNAELPKRFQISELPAEKPRKRAKVCGGINNLVEASPNTSLIPATPETSRVGVPLGKKNLLPRKMLSMMSVPAKPPSVPSSPDEVAGTPPSNITKKDHSRRGRMLSFFPADGKESDVVVAVNNKKEVVYALDTQDVDEVQIGALSTVLKENIIVPATLNPESYEENAVASSKMDKENNKSPPKSSNNQHKTIADLSTDVEFPTTPKKQPKSRERSPILGKLSGQKSTSRMSSSSASGNGSSKINRSGPSSAVNAAEISCWMTSDGQRCKKTVQQRITSFTSNSSKSNKSLSKLSLKKESQHKDVSKCLDAKDGHQVVADQYACQLSEKEQIEIAISNSIKENYFPLEDSDATIFVPISPCHEKANSVKQNREPQKLPAIVKNNQEQAASEAYFEPIFASTAKEDVKPNNLKSRASQMAPSASQFKPPFASTEKCLTENSALHDLTRLLDAQDLDDTAPYPPDTSYDHLPKKETRSPDYKFQGKPVRKKNDRKALPGHECRACAEYYAAMFDTCDEELKQSLMNGCSRHRDRNGPRPNTPREYWDIGWTSPAEVKKHQEVSKLC